MDVLRRPIRGPLIFAAAFALAFAASASAYAQAEAADAAANSAAAAPAPSDAPAASAASDGSGASASSAAPPGPAEPSSTATAPSAAGSPAPSVPPASTPPPAAQSAATGGENDLGGDDLPKPAETAQEGSLRVEQRLEEATDAQTAAAIRAHRQAPSRISIRRGEFDKPLLFSPDDNGLKLTNPQVKWIMADGLKINMGGVSFGSEQIGFVASQAPRSKLPRFYRPRGSAGPPAIAASFRWPEILGKEGSVQIVGPKGEVLWRKTVEPFDREDWADLFAGPEKKLLSAHYKSQWGEVDVDPAQWTFLNSRSTLRACFQRREGRTEKLLACSRPFRIVRQGGEIKVVDAPSQSAPGVSINGVRLGESGIVNFPPGKSIRIKAQFKDGAMVEVSGAPLKLDLLDAVRAADGRVKLMGQGAKPIGQVRNLVVPADHFWSATPEDKPQIVWELTLPEDAPTVRVLGAFNIPYTYVFQYRELPNEADRPYISSRLGTGTYLDGGRVEVISPAGDSLASRENSVKNEGKGVAVWRFKAAEKGKTNRARISVIKPDGKKYVAHYEMHRGKRFEASGRLTGVATQTLQTVILGELAGSAWFEDLSFSGNHWLGRRRWGATFRYFQALTPIEIGEGQTLDSLRSANADYKYNFVPGIWNRDELFGAMASFQNIDIGGIGANLGGFGFYWARTMPKFLDDLFNLIPLMRKAKYVDVEFIYYPLAVFSNVSPGYSYNLNFHGKVFWGRSLYGEAGFGLRQYNFEDPGSNSAISFGMAYGTVGLGWTF